MSGDAEDRFEDQREAFELAVSLNGKLFSA